MARIILNPTTGAPISNIQIEGKKYFVDKPFATGTMVKIEDDKVSEVLLGIFGFLILMTPEDAKKYREETARKKYPCAECGEVLMSDETLKKHAKKHEEDAKLDKELGIEVVEAVAVEGSTEIKSLSPQEAIDAEARAAGLDYGEGIRKEGI